MRWRSALNFGATITRSSDVPIIVRLDVELARRKMTSKDLAAKIGISEQNLSVLRSGKARGVRFNTLEAICAELGCQPGDLLEFDSD